MINNFQIADWEWWIWLKDQPIAAEKKQLPFLYVNTPLGTNILKMQINVNAEIIYTMLHIIKQLEN